MNKTITFRLLLAAQSLSAFGDNAVFSVIAAVLLGLVKTHQLSLPQLGVQSAVFANCLLLPYVVLAPLAGWLSDRFPKKHILVAANLIKVLGCLLAVLSAATGQAAYLAAYLIIGIGAAIYSPSKYGIIPELKDEAGLVRANAAMEMTTILAILTGIVGGGLLFDRCGAPTSFLILLGLYSLATVLNAGMGSPRQAQPDERFGRAAADFGSTLKKVSLTPALAIPVFGTTIFWFSASFIKLNLQTWGQHTVGLTTATQLSLLALWLSAGIVIGSFLAGKIFRTGQIRPTWRFGLAMGALVLVMVGKYVNYWLLAGELVVLGALGGIFLIPLNAELQANAELEKIGKVIAIQNLFENGAMLLSAGLFWGVSMLSVSPVLTFVLIGVILCLVNIVWLRPAVERVTAGNTSTSAATPD
jgi:LPLT family lysophospholipid transporter-like MFS transporter